MFIKVLWNIYIYIYTHAQCVPSYTKGKNQQEVGQSSLDFGLYDMKMQNKTKTGVHSPFKILIEETNKCITWNVWATNRSSAVHFSGKVTENLQHIPAFCIKHFSEKIQHQDSVYASSKARITNVLHVSQPTKKHQINFDFRSS